jgi:flavin-dependent dehydrogenase
MPKPFQSHPDVAIIGGGPAGSTIASLLRKYRPRLKVAIYEREAFPRDHVGESQLPHVSTVLDEMGVWDKVEAANFPVKIGATYRWGQTNDLWDFEFLNNGVFKDEPRPGKYVGQRTQTAFQVDRAIYDKILLDHAQELGCEVFEEAWVKQVHKEGDTVTSLTVQHDGVEHEVKAKYYIDCSGHVGILRREMGVEIETPSTLQNIAIWDYWQNADWAVNIGVGGTRVQVLSQGYGWLWFIPLGPTRTSIGLIVPASYYKESGKKPAELYAEAMRDDKVVQLLTKNATSENSLTTTKDWSFIASRLVGDNWFLAGECAGFADPILAAGMTLAHKGARDVAYTIIELERGDFEDNWLKQRYCNSHRRHIRQHITFADFWYTQNGLFSDLKDFTKELAGDAGLEMTSDEAWRWFGTGGFIDHDTAGADVGGYALYAAKNITATFLDQPIDYKIFGKTHFVINLEGATETWGANLHEGRIHRHPAYVRDNKSLPMVGVCGWLAHFLTKKQCAKDIIKTANTYRAQSGMTKDQMLAFPRMMVEALEAMVLDGWVIAETKRGFDPWPQFTINYERFMHINRDIAQQVAD